MVDTLNTCEDVYLLNPDGVWNPHSDVYARNEESMLDWEGNRVCEKDRQQILLSEVEEDKHLSASLQISSLETKTIDDVFMSRDEIDDKEAGWIGLPAGINQVSSVLGSISNVLEPSSLCSKLVERVERGGDFNVPLEQHFPAKRNFLKMKRLHR